MKNSEIIKKVDGKTIKITYHEYKNFSAANYALKKLDYQNTKSVYCWSNLAYYRKEDSYAIIISDDEIYNDDKVGVLKYTRE